MKTFFSYGFPNHRGRRLRQKKGIRSLVAESNLIIEDLVMPYFIKEDNDNDSTSITSGIKRFTINELLSELDVSVKNGIKAIALFPKIPHEKKSIKAIEAWNENNLVVRTLKLVKKSFPDLITICDIALDAYTSSGHDGLVDDMGHVVNDSTIKCLEKMSLNFAQAGCEVLAPSDMMDGRIKRIRESLENNNFNDVCILSYSSKFCSNFYSPFRDVLGSIDNLGQSKKNTYQIDYRNRKEALKESLEDIHEGADMIMVKPAGYYLDIVREICDNSLVPVAAYQVSGEYCLIKNASDNGLINYKDCVIESLSCIKRSGAKFIFSYFSAQVAEWLKKDSYNI
tara:strand:+ start:271 stop:1290 length:1020 start_codon:yes stop_codon:yes gene_type:complete